MNDFAVGRSCRRIVLTRTFLFFLSFNSAFGQLGADCIAQGEHMKSPALKFAWIWSVVLVGLLAANWSADEYKSGIDWPEPAIVDPGDSMRPPSDAIVLFDGKSLAAF